MKRAEKLVLLAKILEGKVNKQEMEQAKRSNGPGAVTIVYEIGDPDPGHDDLVSFNFKGKQVTMPYREIKAFTRYDPLTICFIPDNHRRTKPANGESTEGNTQ